MTNESCTKFEDGLAEIEQLIKDIPPSPSLTILSHESWNPYSQYAFNKDGSIMIDSVKPLSVPSVPEVLCINLPTGFDVSELSKPSINKDSVPESNDANSPSHSLTW